MNLRVLAWAETDGGPEPLDVAAEIGVLRAVEDEVPGLKVITYVDQPFERLATVIGTTAHDVFHFIGHANKAGELLVHGAFGEVPLPTRQLRLLLQDAPDGGPQGVVLNACWSGRRAMDAAPKGGWVVAMNAQVSDAAALEFSRTFYTLLVAKRPPDVANRLARKHVRATLFGDEDAVQRVWPGRQYGYAASPYEPVSPRDVRALEFMTQAFERSAYRTPAIEELSYEELSEAIDHTKLMLTTGAAIRRDEPTQPFQQVAPDLVASPALVSLRRHLLPLLDRLGLVALQLQSLLPARGFHIYVLGLSEAAHAGQWELVRQALSLMDQVDQLRNDILGLVNAAVEDLQFKPFDPIPLSSERAARWGVVVPAP